MKKQNILSFGLVLVLTLAWVGSGGCGTGGSATAAKRGTADAAAAWIDPIDWTGASERIVRTSHRRIVDDLPRTAERLGWGILRRSPVLPPEVIDGDRPVLVLEMLLASERRVYVGAWQQVAPASEPAPEPGDEAVRSYRIAVVGARLPSPDVQQRYLDMLDKTLADAPKPRRGGKFILP